MAREKPIGTLFFLCALLAAYPFGACAGPVEQARELNLRAADLMAEGKLSEAAAAYRQAIQLNPQSAGYHSNLALVLKDLNELPAAEQEARLAVRLNSEKPSYKYNLGVISTDLCIVLAYGWTTFSIAWRIPNNHGENCWIELVKDRLKVSLPRA